MNKTDVAKRNDLIFNTIQKYFPNNRGCSLKLIKICSTAMNAGENLFKQILLRGAIPSSAEESKLIKDAVKQFMADNQTCMDDLPVSYRTRKMKKLTSFIHDAIYAGMLLGAEVILELMSK